MVEQSLNLRNFEMKNFTLKLRDLLFLYASLLGDKLIF